jgi:ketosteroid isomerase-like protein
MSQENVEIARASFEAWNAGDMDVLRDLLRKRMKGFEPSTFAMARRRSSQLSYIRAKRSF